MPNNTHLKTNGFNLIRNELDVMTDVRYKKDWYMLVNILIISLVLAFSILAVLLQLNLQSRLDYRTAELANKINANYNPSTRAALRGRISSFEDKLSIYKDFQEQNFDLNSFYNDVVKIYPGIKVTKFVVQPDSETVDIILSLESKGYTELPEFLKALDSSKRFAGSTVKGVTFLPSDATNSKTLVETISNTDSYKMEVSLQVKKTQE